MPENISVSNKAMSPHKKENLFFSVEINSLKPISNKSFFGLTCSVLLSSLLSWQDSATFWNINLKISLITTPVSLKFLHVFRLKFFVSYALLNKFQRFHEVTYVYLVWLNSVCVRACARRWTPTSGKTAQFCSPVQIKPSKGPVICIEIHVEHQLVIVL